MFRYWWIFDFSNLQKHRVSEVERRALLLLKQNFISKFERVATFSCDVTMRQHLVGDSPNERCVIKYYRPEYQSYLSFIIFILEFRIMSTNKDSPFNKNDVPAKYNSESHSIICRRLSVPLHCTSESLLHTACSAFSSKSTKENVVECFYNGTHKNLLE